MTPWRRKLFAQTEAHLEFLAPTPLFLSKTIDTKKRLVPQPGLGAGDRVAVAQGAAEADPRTALDADAPADSQVVLLATANTYGYTKLENQEVGRLVAKDQTLATAIGNGSVIALKNPIPVVAGEILGRVAATPPSDSKLQASGAFLHLETFAEASLLTGGGYVKVAAKTAAKLADRKAVYEALLAKELVAKLPDDVWLAQDLDTDWLDPATFALRNVELEMPSRWSLDWATVLAGATTLSFMKPDDRDALARKFAEYNWWNEAKAGNKLPASEVVFHYHPITLLMALAYADP